MQVDTSSSPYVVPYTANRDGATGKHDDLHLVPPPVEKETVKQHNAPKDPQSHKQKGGWLIYLLIALLALVLGAGVAGGIAGALSPRSCRKELNALQNTPGTQPSSCNSTNGGSGTSSAETDAFPIPKTDCTIENNSNGIGTRNTSTDEQIFVSVKGYNFRRFCQSDFTGSDLVSITSPTWDLCMEACASVNEVKANNAALYPSSSCEGITFVPSWINPTYAINNISFPANCFLKFAMPTTPRSDATWEIVVAKLQ